MDRIWAATDYAVIDLETTDCNPSWAWPCEIAGVTIRRGTLDDMDSYHTYINPEKTISRGSIEVHGLTRAMLKSAPRFRNQDEAFRAFLNEKLIVIHSGSGYDVKVLQRRMKGYVFPTVIDSCKLARSLDSSSPDHKLTTLVERYELASLIQTRLEKWEISQIPRKALYDAYAAAYVFQYLVRRCIDTRCALRNIIDAQWK